MPRSVILGLAVSSLTLAVAYAPPANACSLGPGVMTTQLPAGPTMPSNGLVTFETLHFVCPADASVFSVTVDGQPAGLALSSLPFVAYRVEPAPAEGAQIELISGVADGVDDWNLESCEYPAPFTVRAAAADNTPPSVPLLGVSVEPDDATIVGCNEPDEEIEQARWNISIEPDVNTAVDHALYTVALHGPNGAVESQTLPILAAVDGGPVTTSLFARRENVSEGTYCVRVRTFDAAGNEADVAEACDDVDPDQLFGCACSATNGRPPGWAIVLLALVPLLRRRRHRHDTQSCRRDAR